MKKRISFLLAALFAVASLWAQEFQSGELTYYLDEGGNVFVVWGDYENLTEIIIPGTVEYEGTSYAVTIIGGSAFSGCTSLTSINIPNSVTSINYGAFADCTSLTSINIPNSVTSIGESAFNGCTSLTSINIPNSVTSIGESAFNGCTSLTSINIPNSVTSIGKFAFSKCSELISITVETENMVYDSRENCNAIIETASNTLMFGCKNTVIPNSVTSIGDHAFYECQGLTSINIPESVTSIGKEAFGFCISLSAINFPKGMTKIGWGAFQKCPITSIFIPNSVTEIGSYAFHMCSEIESIKVESGNDFYDSSEDCNAILEKEPFGYHRLVRGCKNTIIPNSVHYIDKFAFSACKGLTSIVIPEYVVNIYNWAFWGCSDLKYIIVKPTVPPIVFWNEDLGFSTELPIYVPMESVSAYKSATYWKDLNIIGYDETGIDGVISDKADMTPRKVLQNGKLIIRKTDKNYDLNGMEIK